MTNNDGYRFPGFIATSWRSWPDPRKGPMLIGIHLGEVDGRAECVGIELWTVPPPARRDPQTVAGPPAPIRAEDVRVPLGRIVDEAIDQHERLAKVVVETGTFSPKAVRGAKRMMDFAEDRPRRGGRPALYGPDHFAEVAKVYSQAWAKGGAAKPRKAVMDHWGVSADTAAKWIGRCRHELGLLGPTDQGKAGGIKPAKNTRRAR